MRAQTVRQSLLIYALVVSFAVCFAITTVAIFQMIAATRIEQSRAARRELAVFVDGLSAVQVTAKIAGWDTQHYDELAVVTASSAGHSLSWSQVKAKFRKRDHDPASKIVILRLSTDSESFLLARLLPQSELVASKERIRFILTISLIAAVLAGLLLGFLNSRIVLPPLASLQYLASQAQLESTDFDSDQAPNEIAQVAQSFRRTVRKLGEERQQLEEKHRELQAVQAGMSRASKLASLGRVAAGVAHEIGNPLAAIKGYLSLVKRGLEPKEQEDVLERCVSELDRIHETIRQLLTYARRDHHAGERVPFDISSTIEDVLSLARNHPALRNVKLTLEGNDEINVMGHPEAVRQVILNLVLNAGQALDQTTDPHIEISVQADDGRATIHIADNGPGIPADIRDQVFDPFFTTKDLGEGTGLGLAVSRALMEGMNGKLKLIDEPERGAEFVLEFARG